MKRIFSFLTVRQFEMILIVSLIGCYFWGARVTRSYLDLKNFNAVWVMDSAQIARNTINGHFFVSKYILPLGYSFFPTVTNYPDFIRYPLPILIYSLLFAVFSPNALCIKLLNALLFLLNGWLIYMLVLKVENLGGVEEDLKKGQIQKWIALFVAIAASVFEFDYYQMALYDHYEILAVTMLLITFNAVVKRKIHPLLLGLIFGLLYLSKPTFALLILVFTLYYLMGKHTFKGWLTSGLLCVLGFSIIIAPFVIRSLAITGEPLFALQHKVDNIKDTTISHDALYRTFLPPPSLLNTILENKTAYFNRWFHRIVVTGKLLLQVQNLVIWIGIPLLFFTLKKSRSFLFAYLIFFAIHLIVVANYLLPEETERVYTPLLQILFLFGFFGLFTAISRLVLLIHNSKLQNSLVVLGFVIMLMTASVLVYRGALSNKISDRKDDYPADFVQKIHVTNPPCVYSNQAIETAWFLDVPTIYSPLNLDEIFTLGPKECNYFLLSQKNQEISYYGDLKEFLLSHGTLLDSESNLKFYRIDR